MSDNFVAAVSQNFETYNNDINNYINKDHGNTNSDLDFKEPTSARYFEEQQAAFIKTETKEFPDLIARQTKHPDVAYKLGILPSINQAWLSTGMTLFLWDYVKNSEVFRYECGETVQNVDVLNFSTHNELVVSTDNNLFLHGISQDDATGKLKILSKTGTNTFGDIMSNVITTQNKRVFMKGSSGHLYELAIVCDMNGVSRSFSLYCRTEAYFMKYLRPYIKSAPYVAIKSFVVNSRENTLLVLFNDSSIQSINVQGSQYVPLQKYQGTDLESIHLFSPISSFSVNLVAVTNKGDRLYFSCKESTIKQVHTRLAPPLPGSLLFNRLTNENLELSFYNQGVFASILCKSEKKYLVLTSADSVKTGDSVSARVENVYCEEAKKQLWSVIESSPVDTSRNYYLEPILESLEDPKRQISTLSADGITHYIKQRPIDHLNTLLSSNSQQDLKRFIDRYGYTEAVGLGFLLACSSPSQDVAHFINNSRSKQEGLLLRISRFTSRIWNKDMMTCKISTEDQIEFKSVQDDLKRLHYFVGNSNIGLNTELVQYLDKIIGAIYFIQFMHEQDWDTIVTSLPNKPSSFTLSQLVSSYRGAALLKDVVLESIKTCSASNNQSKLTFISDYLEQNCNSLFESSSIEYYKGVECLQSAHSRTGSERERAFKESLHHHKGIAHLLSIDDTRSLCQDCCSLGNHSAALDLIYAKYVASPASDTAVFDLLFKNLKYALDKSEEYGQSTIQKALTATNDKVYHFEIYNWLRKNNDFTKVLVKLDTPFLVDYFTTELPNDESLECLHQYYVNRQEYAKAIQCLFELATKNTTITLPRRVESLKQANGYLPLATADISEKTLDEIKLTFEEAKIQLRLHDILIKERDNREVAEKLGSHLKSAIVLYDYACTYDMYEEALYLMDIMDMDDWEHAKKAWTCIIEQCKDGQVLKAKIIELGSHLYPSIPSFPVYILVQMLEDYASKNPDESEQNFTLDILLKVGVPKEVIDDAKATFS